MSYHHDKEDNGKVLGDDGQTVEENIAGSNAQWDERDGRRATWKFDLVVVPFVTMFCKSKVPRAVLRVV